jgi:hypothetical protein
VKCAQHLQGDSKVPENLYDHKYISESKLRVRTWNARLKGSSGQNQTFTRHIGYMCLQRDLIVPYFTDC